MKSTNVIILLTATLLFVPLQSKCQEKQLLEKKGAIVTGTIKPGVKQVFSVNPGAGKFLYFTLEQDGIDVAILALDPEGNRVQAFNSAFGPGGIEPVTFFTDKAGEYTLEIMASAEKSREGKFNLKWEKLEPKGATAQQQIDQLFTAWNSKKTPGASVAVEKDGKIVFSKGYGSAELEYDIPITSKTIFHIASVSKQFTCFSVLLLQNEGKLSINDDIRKYLPEVPDFGKTITLNHLMHHTSGLRDQWELLAMAGWRLDDIITKEHILNLVSHQKELNFNPGDEFLYCNTGFTLLAEIVARVSGQSFPDFTRTHIFEPLEMNNTFFYDNCEKIVRNRAYSFDADSNGYKKSILSYSNAGATSLFTTSEDLCLWATNFENPVAGDRKILEQMNQRFILNKGDTITYALGQDIGKYKGLKMISHGGGDAGYRTMLARFPDEKFSVNVLSNYAMFNVRDMAFRIADIYLKDKEIAEPPKKTAPEKKIDADTRKIEIAADTLKSYCGKYLVQGTLMVMVSMENEKLFVEGSGLSKTLLNAVSTDEFDLNSIPVKIKFIKDDSGKISKMMVKEGEETTQAIRVPDFDNEKIDFGQYIGEYYSPELSTMYSFVIEKNQLIARHFRTGDVKLTLVQPDTFSGDQWYFSKIEFTRDSNKNITGFRATGGRVRNLAFKKLPKDNILTFKN